MSFKTEGREACRTTGVPTLTAGTCGKCRLSAAFTFTMRQITTGGFCFWHRFVEIVKQTNKQKNTYLAVANMAEQSLALTAAPVILVCAI